MSKLVTRFQCSECGGVWGDEESASRCEQDDRDRTAREALAARWREIDDESWALTGDDLDEIEAIVRRRAEAIRKP